MEAAIANNPPLLGSSLKIINVKQAVNISIPSVSTKMAHVSLQRRYLPQEFSGRRNNKGFGAIFAAVSGIEIVEAPSHFEDFSVNTTSSSDRELKMRVEVSGAKTQVIFNDVFDKLVAAAQPIPGFRREKGGKTPNIPRDILLEILGPSKVYKQVIKNVINSTVAEYVQKLSNHNQELGIIQSKVVTQSSPCATQHEDSFNGLKVGKDLTVEQSFEDLEDSFEPGETFSFSAVVQLLE